MGNTNSLDKGIKHTIKVEYEKVKTSEKRNYLSIIELLNFQHPEDYPFTFDHLGIIFTADDDKSGQITLEKLYNFAQFCLNNLKNVQTYEFKSQLQAATTMALWQVLSQQDGENEIVEWIGRLLQNNDDVTYFQNYPNTPFIKMESVKVLHEIFHVKMMNGMEIQSFFDLLQQCGEESGLMAIEVEELDEYVPLVIAKEFTREYLRGFCKLMNEISFNNQ